MVEWVFVTFFEEKIYIRLAASSHKSTTNTIIYYNLTKDRRKTEIRNKSTSNRVAKFR